MEVIQQKKEAQKRQFVKCEWRLSSAWLSQGDTRRLFTVRNDLFSLSASSYPRGAPMRDAKFHAVLRCWKFDFFAPPSFRQIILELLEFLHPEERLNNLQKTGHWTGKMRQNKRPDKRSSSTGDKTKQRELY